MNQTEHTAYESLIGMAVVAEYSLPGVELHVRRVRGYAYILTRALGMDEQAAALLADACQLHDVGMVSVPRELVRKEGSLTSDEWQLIHRHAVVGSDLLNQRSGEIFQLASTIALSHHECWDGSGYPHGLVHDEIPLPGRICRIADVFDTLTHPRSYKPAAAPEEVLPLIRESSGSFFDPQLVDLFAEHFQEIQDVRRRFQPQNESV